MESAALTRGRRMNSRLLAKSRQLQQDAPFSHG
jgi:hypothetical protein